ncbi:MAG: helix-turn-helix domain-containing protein, partial [Solirubrobacteraceae bacterium]
MAVRADVTPNRRGMKSRELVLDAAERVMAEHGFEAATLARVVEEAGIPLSSVYHYYGSKDGILLAVMERGAERFFDDLPIPNRRLGRP